MAGDQKTIFAASADDPGCRLSPHSRDLLTQLIFSAQRYSVTPRSTNEPNILGEPSMRKLRTFGRLLALALLALVAVPAALGITAAEAGRRTQSFIR